MVQERVERHHADQHHQEDQHGQEDQHRQEEIMANRILPQKKVSSLSLVVCPIREYEMVSESQKVPVLC